MRQRSQGFTLVELSIVLVIIGLVIGGVMVGQSLIKASQLRSIGTQEQKYVSAVANFRDKYDSLPGDMPDATKVWGVAATPAATCATTSSAGSKLTCDGNGDGRINNDEYFRFWQQLVNAGYLEGNYDGIAHGSNRYSASPLNSPAGQLWTPAYWETIGWGDQVGNGYVFDGQYGNMLEFGVIETNFDPAAPMLTGADAYSVDMKMDDGMPGTGIVRARADYGLNKCTSSNSSSQLNATYLLTGSTIGCSFVFPKVFGGA